MHCNHWQGGVEGSGIRARSGTKGITVLEFMRHVSSGVEDSKKLNQFSKVMCSSSQGGIHRDVKASNILIGALT
jgi:serine/threonine protein kinase